MAKNFLNFVENMNLLIKKKSNILKQENTKKTMSSYTYIKLLIAINNEKILKAARKQGTHSIQGNNDMRSG